MDPYVIEKSFTIHGGGMLRRVMIPARDLKEQDGMTFIHVSSVPTYMIALCCSGSQHGRRPLSKTNVVEKLTALRDAKSCSNELVQEEELQAFRTNHVNGGRDTMRNSAAQKLKRKCDVLSKEIEVDTIQSPTLGDAHGIEMKIYLERQSNEMCTLICRTRPRKHCMAARRHAMADRAWQLQTAQDCQEG